MANISLTVLFFVVGLLVGSFLNVIILRLPEGESPVLGRSKCPKCQKKIAFYDLIPLLSYVILQGKCRNCKAYVSLQYPIVEIISGISFVFLLNRSGFSYLLFLYLVAISALIIIFVYDLRYLEIPEIFAWLFLAVTIILGVTQSNFSLANFLLGGLVGGGILGILVGISDERLMGAGDIKIGLAFGFLFGYPQALLFLFLSFIVGAVIGLILIAIKGKKLKSEIAFAPFMIIAGIITFIWGGTIISSYLSLI